MCAQAPTAYPNVRNRTVYNFLSTGADDVWAVSTYGGASEQLIQLSPTTFISVMSGVDPIPANLHGEYGKQSALIQQTPNSVSSASLLDIKWEEGMFNGMLFRDFVTSGFLFEYVRYTLKTATGSSPDPRYTYASHVNIEVKSASAGTLTSFVWEPYLNLDNQGPMLYQDWVTNRINDTTGTNGSWPWASVSAYGKDACMAGSCCCVCGTMDRLFTSTLQPAPLQKWQARVGGAPGPVCSTTPRPGPRRPPARVWGPTTVATF